MHPETWCWKLKSNPLLSLQRNPDILFADRIIAIEGVDKGLRAGKVETGTQVYIPISGLQVRSMVIAFLLSHIDIIQRNVTVCCVDRQAGVSARSAVRTGNADFDIVDSDIADPRVATGANLQVDAGSHEVGLPIDHGRVGVVGIPVGVPSALNSQVVAVEIREQARMRRAINDHCGRDRCCRVCWFCLFQIYDAIVGIIGRVDVHIVEQVKNGSEAGCAPVQANRG